MEFQTLSRKELQVLCKAHGIPANRSNIFMAEALASKRIPLSQVDANRGQKKLNIPAEKKSRNGDDAGPKKDVARAEQKEDASTDLKFKNNFLRRGTRRDTSLPQNLAPLESAARPDTLRCKDDCTTSCQGASKVAKGEPMGVDTERPDDIIPNVGRPDLGKVDVGVPNDGRINVERLDFERSDDKIAEANVIRSETSAADTATSRDQRRESAATHSVRNPTDNGKEHQAGIAERVRSQVDAALCSKAVVHGTVRSALSVVAELGDPGPHSPPRHGTLDQRASETHIGEAKMESTPSRHGPVETVASPPLKFSPLLLLVEEKVRSAIEKVCKFWGRDASSVNSGSSSSDETTT